MVPPDSSMWESGGMVVYSSFALAKLVEVRGEKLEVRE